MILNNRRLVVAVRSMESGMSRFSKAGWTHLRKGALAGVVAAAAVIAAALPAAAAEVTIHLTGANSYDPKSQPVKAGDKIVWVNDADVQHTVTPDAGQPAPFPGSPVLKKKGATHKWTVAGKPRTIKYHCRIHGAAMAGEIVIAP